MLIYSLFLHLVLWFHPFHVSVCTMHYAEEEESIQITLKIFADDLEETLNDESSRKSEQTYIDVLNPKDKAALTHIVSDYLDKHLEIIVNGNTTKPVFLGYEMEGMAMWCYLEISNIAQISQIAVENAILTEIFDDQINIVHVEYKGDTKSMKLAGNKLSDVIKF